MKISFLYLIVCFNIFFTAGVSAQSWVNVGIADFSDSARNIDFAIDRSGTPYVVFQDLDTISFSSTVMKLNGSNWAFVGNPGFTPYASTPALAIDSNGTPFVAFSDGYYLGNGITVMKYDDTGWETVGDPDFFPGSLGGSSESPSLAFDRNNTPYVSFVHCFSSLA